MCNNTVIQTVPSGYDYKFIEMKCGSTSIHGDELRCEKCENGGPPWYICPHGRDVSEYDCGLCELD